MPLTHLARSLCGATNNGKITGINELNANQTILKKMNISFTVHFSVFGLVWFDFMAYQPLWVI